VQIPILMALEGVHSRSANPILMALEGVLYCDVVSTVCRHSLAAFGGFQLSSPLFTIAAGAATSESESVRPP
jgi:hypothetical protein